MLSSAGTKIHHANKMLNVKQHLLAEQITYFGGLNLKFQFIRAISSLMNSLNFMLS